MAQTIGEHGLYCPDPQDYAAYALYMQDLGTRIDSALQGQLDALNDFLRPPLMLLTNSVAKVIPASDALSNVFDTVLINTSTYMTYDFTTNRLHIGSENGISPVVPYRRGAYTYGAGVRMTATGAVTVGSLRRLQLFVSDPALSLTLGNISGPLDDTEDRNTGGNEALNVESNFLLTGTNGVYIEHVAVSNNAASTTSIPAGSAFLWVFFNGATGIIEVA